MGFMLPLANNVTMGSWMRSTAYLHHFYWRSCDVHNSTLESSFNASLVFLMVVKLGDDGRKHKPATYLLQVTKILALRFWQNFVLRFSNKRKKIVYDIVNLHKS